MGFDVGGNTARLEFMPGTVLDGATVRVSLDMSVRDFMAMQRTIASVPADASVEDKMVQDERMFAAFAETALISWDLERDGQPIPATPDGLLSLPVKAANALYVAWLDALRGAPPNSPPASETTAAVSLNGKRSEADFVMTAPV